MYTYAMERTTVMADPAVLERLKRLARQRGVPFSEVVREALADKAREFRPKPASLGAGRSAEGIGAVDWEQRVPGRPWR